MFVRSFYLFNKYILSTCFVSDNVIGPTVIRHTRSLLNTYIVQVIFPLSPSPLPLLPSILRPPASAFSLPLCPPVFPASPAQVWLSLALPNLPSPCLLVCVCMCVCVCVCVCARACVHAHAHAPHQSFSLSSRPPSFRSPLGH